MLETLYFISVVPSKLAIFSPLSPDLHLENPQDYRLHTTFSSRRRRSRQCDYRTAAVPTDRLQLEQRPDAHPTWQMRPHQRVFPLVQSAQHNHRRGNAHAAPSHGLGTARKQEREDWPDTDLSDRRDVSYLSYSGLNTPNNADMLQRPRHLQLPLHHLHRDQRPCGRDLGFRRPHDLVLRQVRCVPDRSLSLHVPSRFCSAC